MFMKRVTFIILWTIAFAVLTLLVGGLSFALLGRAGAESWNQDTIVKIGVSWSVIFFGMPVLGLVLGLLGKLPGTKRSKS